MAVPILYSTDLSPPCRAVLLTIKATGINVKIEETSLLVKDHLKEDFVKMNPQHTIPTLNDNGFILSDSHAIMIYLLEKYGKDDFLYPKDLQKRALIHKYLHFENGCLFAHEKAICYPIYFEGATKIPQDRVKPLINCVGFLEKFLGDRDWLVGDTYTLADISVVSTVSGLSVFFSLDAFPKVQAWLKRCEAQLPGYATVNTPGNEIFMDSVRERIRD